MNWKLFADGSLDSDRGRKDPLIPGGWASILQREGTNEEVVCYGAEMTTSSIYRMEMRAVLRGLQLTNAGDHVRIFSDNLSVLGSILTTAELSEVGNIFSSIEPAEKRTEYRTELESMLRKKKGSSKRGRILMGCNGDKDLLKELGPLLQRRSIAFTKVSDVKTESGRKLFATHTRCDCIARGIRRHLAQKLGRMRPEDIAEIKWPYIPEE